jgi:hypothetical protein
VQPINGILRKIKDIGKDKAIIFLGCLGAVLDRFVSKLDLDNPHPDLYKITDFVSDDTESFNTICCNALTILPMIQSCGLRELVLEFVMSHSATNRIERSSYVRLIEDKDARESLRRNKRTQFFTVDLSLFDADLYDFGNYVRGNNLYENYVQQAMKKIDLFKSYDLKEMVADIQHSVDKIKWLNENSQHYGFNSISLNDAAGISAIMHGFVLDTSRSFVISVEFIESVISELTSLPETLECVFGLYPLHEWLPLRPSEEMEKLIDFIEKYPENNFKPLFDYFWVLIPQVKSLYHYQSNLIIDKFSKSDKITPILLGERDGVHYFISYWV